MMGKKVLFIDRDGTLIVEPDDKQVDRLDKVRLTRDVIPALLSLSEDGYRFVMVSNQDGLGTDSFPEADFQPAHDLTMSLFSSQGIEFDEEFICPHMPGDGCDCRKPRAGLLTRYLAANAIDLEHSAVIGDRETDLELAESIGVRGILFVEDGPFDQTWPGIRAALCSDARRAEVHRKTRETDIRVAVDLDAEGPVEVSSGIGFYDHMLEQIAKHGGFRLQLSCDGDLHIDAHHTVEDTAIALGTAIREALGDKRGIGRYGFLLPMDESQAQVAMDLAGRAYFRFDGEIPGDRIGELALEMVPHFFHSLADSLGAALHIRIEGDNAHHMVEACFKAVGRCLRQAISVSGSDLPSTKGVL